MDKSNQPCTHCGKADASRGTAELSEDLHLCFKCAWEATQIAMKPIGRYAERIEEARKYVSDTKP